METFFLERRYNIDTKLPFSSQGCLCVVSALSLSALKQTVRESSRKYSWNFFFMRHMYLSMMLFQYMWTDKVPHCAR